MTLDLGEDQNPAVRGQPTGVERDLHRLAADRWQAGAKRGNIRPGGRELGCPEGSCLSTRILHYLNGLVCARQLLMNFPG